MSFYSSIDRRINADQWFRGLSHNAQLVWFRLLTGPHVNMVAGLWPAREEGLAREFGFTLATFRKLFREVSMGPDGQPSGKVLADWKAGVIWFPRAIHVPANQPRNEKTLKGWIKYIELVPECELRDRALTEIIRWANSNPKRFPNGLPNGFPIPGKQYLKQYPELDRILFPTRASEAEAGSETGSGSGAERAPPAPDGFAMHPKWEPTADTVASLETGLMPSWAIRELVGRYRTHFVANPNEKRTAVAWNQAFSKWAWRDWNDLERRPKKPPVEEDPSAPEVWSP